MFLDCRQSALELERLTEQRKQEEEAWYRQQKLLMEAEDQRRKMLEVEEKKLTDQRARYVHVGTVSKIECGARLLDASSRATYSVEDLQLCVGFYLEFANFGSGGAPPPHPTPPPPPHKKLYIVLVLLAEVA